MGTYQGNPLGGALFTLTHFRALCSTTRHFHSYLFPSIVNDTHIIRPLSIVSSAYEHFQTKFHVTGFFIQPHKCVAWSPFGLAPNFNTQCPNLPPNQLRIKVLGVPLCTSSFTSSFIKNALLKDVQHVDILLKKGDVQVAFGILTHYFMQWPSYFLQCTPLSFTFIKSFNFFYSSFLQMFGHLLGPGSFDNPKGPLERKQASLPITFGGTKLILMATIAPTTYLRYWAFIASIITTKLMVYQHPFLLEALARVDNNTFPFQRHFKVACDLLPPATRTCFLLFSFLWT
jgi:hypothetical protein